MLENDTYGHCKRFLSMRPAGMVPVSVGLESKERLWRATKFRPHELGIVPLIELSLNESVSMDSGSGTSERAQSEFEERSTFITSGLTNEPKVFNWP